MKMETTMVHEEEDIVIVGAGIAGLTTSLGLHRMGLRSLVLESSESLRVTGFAFTTWTNAWKALDAIGIGNPLRQQHDLLQGLEATSTVSGLLTSQISFVKAQGKLDEGHEVRCVGRKMLLETLEKELPAGTIRFCSKVVSIEEDGYSKLVHLEDGCTFKTKVLIGCDGVNSVVAKWLGLQLPAFTGRCAIRGIAEFHESHHFESKFMQFFGDGFRSGFLPCNQTTMYWFFTYTPSARSEINNSTVEEPTAMKQFVLNNLGKVPKELVDVVEKTEPESIISSPLRLRWPWSVLWGDINKGNVCVAGDALHPMTPDIGQGGCAALEDGVVLARCLAEALLASRKSRDASGGKGEASSIKKGLEKYAKERRWRSCELITTAYVVGLVQQSSGKLINTIRDKLLSTYMAGILLKRADFDCGKLAM